MDEAIVISQPMLFPWVGLFEQLRLSKVFVHYDDVQLPHGRSFTNRVQIKTDQGIKWLTIPLKRERSDCLIGEAEITYEGNWNSKHLKFLQHAFHGCANRNDALDIVSDVYSKKFTHISALNIYAFEAIARYFSIADETTFRKSSDMSFATSSSRKLLDIVNVFGMKRYITGMGAMNYIDYDLFESDGVMIEYINYEKRPYTQKYGDFTPYVSILDLIANEGQKGERFIASKSVYWKNFVKHGSDT